MTIESAEGGRYFIHVDESNLSVYVSWQMNDVIGTDDEEPYTFYRYPRVNQLVSVGSVSGGPINPTSVEDGPITLNSAPTDETLDDTPATTYAFALDGRRVSKAGFVNLTYLYDGENVVYELWDGVRVRFTHPVASGGGCGSGCGAGNCEIFFTDHPISILIDGVKYYYLYDGLGSVTELIDVNQNVVNYYRYTPFGDALVREETVYNPHQYTGRQYDAESGLYHYRARAYSADIGRFMQQDPAGMADGPNMYAYCENDPVNRRDPSGRAMCQGVYMWCVKPIQIKPTLTSIFWDCMRGKGAITSWTIGIIIGCVLACHFIAPCATTCAWALGGSTASAISGCLVMSGAVKWTFTCLWWQWGVYYYWC